MNSFKKEYNLKAEAIVMVYNEEVYCSDIDDYDVLSGMDIITQTDFLITNKDGKTNFQFRTPSEDGVEL